jgi:transglutaminase-like putative cysteine protease
MRSIWRIIPDPDDAEFVRTPQLQISQGLFAGDCDDAATLTCSLLAALHIPCAFVAVRMTTETAFSHVFARGFDRYPRVSVDIDPVVSAAEMPIQGIGEQMIVAVP